MARTNKHTKTRAVAPARAVAGGAITLLSLGAVFVGAYALLPLAAPMTYTAGGTETPTTTEPAARTKPTVAHMRTPGQVRAVYMTACVAATPDWRSRIVSMIERTELNALVIDIKDYTGGISFTVDDPRLAPAVGESCRVSDMRAFIKDLHDRGIYTIGRITVFQDPLRAQRYPKYAVKRESDGSIWTDKKGLSYIDPGAQAMWEQTVALATESYNIGFDELNFDYIRFPSDGNMDDIRFPVSGPHLETGGAYGKANVLDAFFTHLSRELKDPDRYGAYRHTGGTDSAVPVLSADIFGMTTTNTDDLNIGQVLELVVPHFDYIAPMVYPSHYSAGFRGLADPNDDPYEVVRYSMQRARERLRAPTTTVPIIGAAPVSTTTHPFVYKKPQWSADKLRPWLQDFDYGGTYGAAEVRAQIQAVSDAGLDSWMLWDPANTYTEKALIKND